MTVLRGVVYKLILEDRGQILAELHTKMKDRLFVWLLLNGTSALFRPLVPRIVEVEHTRNVKNEL